MCTLSSSCSSRGKRGLNTRSVPGLLWATTADRDLGEDRPPCRHRQGGEWGFWGAVRGDQREAVRHLHNSGGGKGGFLPFGTLPALWPSPGHGLGHTHTHSVTHLFHESVVRKILPLFLDPKTSPNYPSLTSWVWVRVCAHRQCHLACAGLPLAPPTVSLWVGSEDLLFYNNLGWSKDFFFRIFFPFFF